MRRGSGGASQIRNTQFRRQCVPMPQDRERAGFNLPDVTFCKLTRQKPLPFSTTASIAVARRGFGAPLSDGAKRSVSIERSTTMTRTSLTDTQLVILSAAAQREDLRVNLPERLRGSAAKAFLSTLLAKALVEAEPEFDGKHRIPGPENSGRTGYRISPEGLAAIGIESEAEQETAKPDGDGLDNRSEVPPAEYDGLTGTTEKAAASSVPRAGTKLADVIALLEREEGASIDQLTGSTGWLSHTTRAALTGLRKRGILVERAKRDDGATVYRIPPAELAETTVEAA